MSNLKFRVGQKVRVSRADADRNDNCVNWLAGPVKVGTTGKLAVAPGGELQIVWDDLRAPKPGYYWGITQNTDCIEVVT